jgi:hypothetical protein
LYWPQVIPYPVPGAPSATVLRQITLPQAAIIAAVSSFRTAAQAAGVTSWHLAGCGCPAAMRRCWNRSRSPSPGSRSPGCRRPGPPRPCSRSSTSSAGDPGNRSPLARLRRHGPRGPAIELLPGAGDDLLRLGPLIRPLIEVHWTRMVAEINGVASAELDLHHHLFGSDRILPPRPLRDGIAARDWPLGLVLGGCKFLSQP